MAHPGPSHFSEASGSYRDNRFADILDLYSESTALGALLGEDANQLLDTAKTHRDKLLSQIDETERTDSARTTHDADQAQQDAERLQEEIDKEAKDLRETLPEEKALEEHIQRLDSEEAVALVELNEQRPFYRLKLLHQKQVDLHEYGVAAMQRMVESEQARLHASKQLLEVERAYQAENKAEYERAAGVLTKRREELVQAHEKMRGVLLRLRELGVSENVQGYLIWASYLGFAALGWYLGELLRGLYDTETGVGAVFHLLAAALAQIGGGSALFTILIALAAPLVLLALCWGVVWMSDKMAIAYDKRHPKRSSERDSAKKKRDRQTLQSFYLTGLPFSTNLQPTNLRMWFVRLVSVYIFLTAFTVVAALLGIAYQSGTANGTATNLPDNLDTLFDIAGAVLYTYLGIAISIIVAGFILVYVTLVAAPRNIRLLVQDDGTPVPDVSPVALAKANIEIVVTLVLFVVVLLFSDVFLWFGGGDGTGQERHPIWNNTSLLAPLLLVVLNGFVLAYGAVYRGLINYLRATNRALIKIDVEIGKYEQGPVLERKVLAGSFSQRIEQLYDDIDEVYAQLQRQADEDLDTRTNWLDDFVLRLKRPAAGLFGEKEMVSTHRIRGITPTDRHFEADLVGRIKRAQLDREQQQAALAQLQKRQRSHQSRLDKLRDQREEANRAAEEAREKLADIKRKYDRQRKDVLADYDHFIADVTTAQQMGTYLRQNNLS